MYGKGEKLLVSLRPNMREEGGGGGREGEREGGREGEYQVPTHVRAKDLGP